MGGWREALEVDVFSISSDGRYIWISQKIIEFNIYERKWVGGVIFTYMINIIIVGVVIICLWPNAHWLETSTPLNYRYTIL